MALLDVGGLRLEVAVDGERTARPLLLLHGFTGTGAEMLDAAKPLGSHRRIAIDLIGHGSSEAPAELERYGFARAIDDLERVLDRLELGAVDVWGYSLGGRLALGLAVEKPSRVRRLVLESASPGLATSAERDARARDDSELAAGIERDGIEAFVARWEALPLFASEHADATAHARRLAQRPHGLANSLRGLGLGAQPCFDAQLGQLRAPTLLITGANDAKFDGIARSMANAIPDVRHISISECGHAPHRERPTETARAISDFLQHQ